MDNARTEVVLVGGGLQSGLLALALVEAGRVPVLVEAEPRLGRGRTWSFHAADVPPGAWSWLEPLVAHRWPAHQVRFPSFQRREARPYCTITADHFDRVVRARVESAGGQVRTGTRATRVSATEVELLDGATLRAGTVIDARGAGPSDHPAAYQKFFGLELELEEDAPYREPILIDATVEQLDGFRFVYVLPFTPRHLLIEDTYYSDTPDLDRSLARRRVLEYARDLRIARIVREERGVLPLPFAVPSDPETGPLNAGWRGGWFHPTTGYSLPVAVRLAAAVAGGSDLGALRAHVRAQQAFCVRLNRTLFGWTPPERRRDVLEHFYRLPIDTIERFYSMELKWLDLLRIFARRPPPGVDVSRVFRSTPLSRPIQRRTP